MKRNRLLLYAWLIIGISCSTSENTSFEIDPPFENINIKESRVTIDPARQQIARFDNGLSIEIPENAFVDEKGNIIHDEVTISIETYNTAAEIIVSGIPMVYQDDTTSGNFESAGMFRISGRTNTSEVYIKEDKNLVVNYPSQVSGDYDFFFFEETENDSVTAGKWVKLTDNLTPDIPVDSNATGYRLKFTEKDYPELAPLTTINWMPASPYGNPTLDENKWVLEEEWTSVDISQPKYGFGEMLIKDKIPTKEYSRFASIFVTKDRNRMLTLNKDVVHIYNKNGDLLRTIDQVDDDIISLDMLNEKFFIFPRTSGKYIYDLDGNEKGKLPKNAFDIKLASENSLIYHTAPTLPDVFVSDISGKIIKRIPVQEAPYSIENNILEHFILTPKDELIINSASGISFYDLKGENIRHRTGQFKSIRYLKDNTLLIEGLDGRLIVWNYIDNTETISKKEDFNIKPKLTGNTFNFSGYDILPNYPYILIDEANSDNSRLWNYESNQTTDLSFKMDRNARGVNLLQDHLYHGQNMSGDLYYLYDIRKQKAILRIDNFRDFIYGDCNSYHITFSPDTGKFIINSKYNYACYDTEGKKIRDFKNYDSLTCLAGFINNEQCFTVSENGLFRIWDIEGNEISGRKLEGINYLYAYPNGEYIEVTDILSENHLYYNLAGDLQINSGNQWIYNFIDSTKLFYINDIGFAVMQSLFELDPASRQLILKNGNKEFITYVYLNDQDRKKIDRYFTFKAKSSAKKINELKEKEKAEQKRQETENILIRRFEINKFGLYNWDILQKQDNLIRFAADFEFDTPVDINAITIFHITDINGPGVFSYNKYTWQEFSLVPDYPNKLLAVLPGNKIALFDNFDNLDFEKIKKDKTFTFEMKTIEKPIMNTEDLKLVLGE